VDLKHNLELPKSMVKKYKYEYGQNFQNNWATQLPWAKFVMDGVG
jgi:hypothetical protein